MNKNEDEQEAENLNPENVEELLDDDRFSQDTENESDLYNLAVSDIGYVLYDEDDFPVVTHCAAPIVHSREDIPDGNMEDVPVPEKLKEGLYLLDLMRRHAEDGDHVKSKAYRKVYEKRINPELNLRESHLITTVWDTYDKEDVQEINRFFNWCIANLDAEKVMEYQFMAQDLENTVREKLDDQEEKEEGTDEQK